MLDCRLILSVDVYNALDRYERITDKKFFSYANVYTIRVEPSKDRAFCLRLEVLGFLSISFKDIPSNV